MSTAEARAYADEIGALFIETSAKVNKGVQAVFEDISHRLPQPVEANFVRPRAPLQTGARLCAACANGTLPTHPPSPLSPLCAAQGDVADLRASKSKDETKKGCC